MNPHPSDLLLERALSGEALPDTVLDHVQTCDLCWMRWTALHADEGHDLPVRPAGRISAPPVLPVPIGFAVGSAALVAMVAIVSVSVAVIQSTSTEQATIAELNDEIAALRLELGTLQGNDALETATEAPRIEATNPEATAFDGATMRASTGTAGSTAVDPSAIPPEVLEAAVEQTIRQRRAEKLDRAEQSAGSKTLDRVGPVVDALVDKGVLTDTEAGEVERVLQEETEETWAIKRAVNDGDLTGEEGLEDWKLLRQETDDALLDYLEPGDVKGLREALEGGGK